MNPTGGAPSLSAVAGTGDATTFLPHRDDWPGLAQASGQLGVPLDASAAARFAQYRKLLLERNAQFNLTAIRDPDEIERLLFLDAIAMAPALDSVIDAIGGKRFDCLRMVDVGAGAGFPGLPMKIVRPSLDLTLIDATAKKVGFINEVIDRLELDAARAIQGRAEEIGQNSAYREQFDIATARAVAPLPVLLEFVVPLLRSGGTAVLPKGLQIADELRDGKRAAAVLGARIISADELPVGRTRLVVVRKVSPTPSTYPRRTGLPSRDPLGGRD